MRVLRLMYHPVYNIYYITPETIDNAIYLDAGLLSQSDKYTSNTTSITIYESINNNMYYTGWFTKLAHLTPMLSFNYTFIQILIYGYF